MLRQLSARTYAATAFLFFLLWFPKDWEDRGDAAAVWARWFAVVDRETLLWLFAVSLLAWLIWTDLRPWWRQRQARKQPWWASLRSFAIGDFACLVAGISPSEFERSDRAKAVAAEIRGYVNSGHMPLMLEEPRPTSLRLQDAGRAPYEPKHVGNDAQVLRGDLEKLAIARGWTLPWETQERKGPVRIPILGATRLYPRPEGTESETQQ